MLIAQVIPRLESGGAERGTVEMCREFVRRGHSCAVVSAGGRMVDEVVRRGGTHLQLPVAGKNVFSAPFRAVRLGAALRELNPDIVHIRSRVPAWLHKISGGRRRFATVATVHGFNRPNFYSRVMTDADAVVCAGPSVADYVCDSFGVAPDKIAIIPRGIDSAHFDPAKVPDDVVDKLRGEFGFGDKRIVLHPGRIAAQKGHEVFLRGMARLRGENIGGVIVGGGEARRVARLRALADSLGVSQTVHFAGERPDMRELLAAADVVASCATKPETFGRTMAEALAMNRPVAAAAHGGATDIVNHPAFGKLFAPNDDGAFAESVLQLLNAPRPNSRPDIERRFSLSQMAEQNLALYRKVLAQRKETRQ